MISTKNLLVAFGVIVMFSIIGCGGVGAPTSNPVGATSVGAPAPNPVGATNIELPSAYFVGATSGANKVLGQKTTKNMVAKMLSGNDLDAFRNNPQTMTWAYYTDKASSRWYISYIGAGKRFGTGSKKDVYSLMKIKTNAGWGTVGSGVATVDLIAQTVSVEPSLDKYPSNSYYDIGWEEWTEDARIHEDRKLIQGSTVPIKWYFFYFATTGRWYIVNAPGYLSGTKVYEFSEKNGDYDWIPIDTAGSGAEFYMENSQQKVRFGGGQISFDYPVGDLEPYGHRSGKGWWVAQDFADEINFADNRKGQHLGEDWNIKGEPTDDEGKPVYAIADGVVIRAEENKSYGHFVMILHALPPNSQPRFVVSLYGHLGPQNLISKDTEVWRGRQIGQIGAADDNGTDRVGNHWPVHLHFEIRIPTTRFNYGALYPTETPPVFGYSLNHEGFASPTNDASSEGAFLSPNGILRNDGWINTHRKL